MKPGVKRVDVIPNWVMTPRIVLSWGGFFYSILLTRSRDIPVI